MTKNGTAEVQIGYDHGHYFAVCAGHHDDGTLCLWLGYDRDEYAEAANDAAWHRLSHAIGLNRP